MNTTKEIKVVSKSQQRRLKEQTGKDVPLSPEAAHGGAPGKVLVVSGEPSEHLALTENADAAEVVLAPVAVVASPILQLTEEMREGEIGNRYVIYRDTEKASAEKRLHDLNVYLGRQVAEAEKLRSNACAAVKVREDEAVRVAQDNYARALRAAKSELDKTLFAIMNDHDSQRAAAREAFQSIVAPLNDEHAKKKAEIVSTFADKMKAAVEELNPILDVARAKEKARVAEALARQKAQEEADAELLEKKAAEGINEPISVESATGQAIMRAIARLGGKVVLVDKSGKTIASKDLQEAMKAVMEAAEKPSKKIKASKEAAAQAA